MSSQLNFRQMKLIWHVRLHSVLNIIRSYVKNKAVWIMLPFLLLVTALVVKEVQRNIAGFKGYGDILFTVDAISSLCILSCIVLCCRSLVRWNKMKLRGAYESLAVYQPQKIGSLYFCYAVDCFVCYFILVFLLGSLLFGDVAKVLLLGLFVGLFALEEFVYCLALYVKAPGIVRICILLANIICALLFTYVGELLRIILLVLMLGMDLLIFQRRGFQFNKYFAETVETKKVYKNRLFSTILGALARLLKNARLAFVISKEIVQIFMEKIPLIYSFVYGLLFTLMALFSYKNNPNNVILLFCFFTSIAYTLVAIAFNFFARDKNKTWLYQLYKVSPADIMFGKYLAYGTYSIGVVVIYVILYRLLAEQNGYVFEIHLKLICELLFMLVPITFFMGAIAGSLFVPTIKYRNRNVDYNYHGMEIIMLLGTAYFISLPMCVFDHFLTNAWWLALPIGVTLQCALGWLLKKRIQAFLLRGN